MGFLRPTAWMRQPPQNVELSAFGLLPLSVFSGILRNRSAVGGLFTAGSATSYGAASIGTCSIQTAVNSGLYQPVLVPSGAPGLMVVWHGIPLGNPSGSTPKFAGISSTASSQSNDLLGIEMGSSFDNIMVTYRSASTAANREFNIGMSSLYGKTVTLVAVYDVLRGEIRLTCCADGTITRFASATSTPQPPVIAGTEQFCVGPDIVEIPTRHTNSKVALAGAFYGPVNSRIEEAIAVNPWQIFKKHPALWTGAGASGGTGGSFAVSATTVAPTFSGSASVSPITSFAVTTVFPTFSGSASAGGSYLNFSLTTTQPTFSGSATGSTTSATITIMDLCDLTTGTLRVNESNIIAIINDVSTGSLVAKLTGQSSTAGGDMVLSHASLVTGTQYRVTLILSDGSEGTWKYTAA